MDYKNKKISGRGVGTIFYIKSISKFMFYLRDDKKSIPYPNQVSLLGGHIDEGETADQALEREFSEELDDLDTGKPYNPIGVVIFKKYVDKHGVEQNIYYCVLPKKPNLRLNEGQYLVFLGINEIEKTNFAFGFREVINEFLKLQKISSDKRRK